MCQARFFARFCSFQLVQTPLAAESPLKLSVAVGLENQENPVEPVILAEMAAEGEKADLVIMSRAQIADPDFEGYCHCMLYYKEK